MLEDNEIKIGENPNQQEKYMNSNGKGIIKSIWIQNKVQAYFVVSSIAEYLYFTKIFFSKN